MIVDFHCHLVPPGSAEPGPPLLRDHDGFLERKAAEGIDRMVVLNAMLNPPGASFDNLSLERVRRWNEFGLDLASREPDRVITFVGLDPFGGDEQLDEARRAARAGSRGLTVTSSVGGRYLDAPELEDFWALVDELQVPVFVHPSGEDSGPGRTDPRLAQFGTRAAEVGLSVAAAIFAGVLDRHPSLRLIAGAGAGGLASLAGRLDAAYRSGAIGRPTPGGPTAPRSPAHPPTAPRSPAHPPSAYLRRIHVDSLLFSPAALRCAIEVFGPDRLLFGTDSPPAPIPPAVTWGLLDRLELSDGARAGVLGENAAALLGLEGASAVSGAGDRRSVKLSNDVRELKSSWSATR